MFRLSGLSQKSAFNAPTDTPENSRKSQRRSTTGWYTAQASNVPFAPPPLSTSSRGFALAQRSSAAADRTPTMAATTTKIHFPNAPIRFTFPLYMCDHNSGLIVTLKPVRSPSLSPLHKLENHLQDR